MINSQAKKSMVTQKRHRRFFHALLPNAMDPQILLTNAQFPSKASGFLNTSFKLNICKIQRLVGSLPILLHINLDYSAEIRACEGVHMNYKPLII